jgi:hypothetical protein
VSSKQFLHLDTSHFSYPFYWYVIVITSFVNLYFFHQKIYLRQKIMYVQKVSKVSSYIKYVASYWEMIQIYGVNLYILVNNSSLNIL